MKIGLIGFGKMGSAISARLSEQEFAVLGWDADPKQMSSLEKPRFEVAQSATEVAAAADIILSIISDDRGVRTLFAGKNGFFETDITGKLFVEMSTVGPATARAVAPMVTERGAGWVEAPVMGTIPAARGGTLLALVGGTEKDVNRAEILFSAITRLVIHLGPAGSGYAAKLCVNLLMASYLQALAESLALGTRSGIPVEQLLEIFQEAPIASAWLKTKLPILQGGEGPPSLDIRTLRKDVFAALAAGADLGVPMPATSGVLSALSAAVAHGDGLRDLACHASFFRENMVQDPLFPEQAGQV